MTRIQKSTPSHSDTTFPFGKIARKPPVNVYKSLALLCLFASACTPINTAAMTPEAAAAQTLTPEIAEITPSATLEPTFTPTLTETPTPTATATATETQVPITGPEWLTSELMAQEGLRQEGNQIINEFGQTVMTFGKELVYRDEVLASSETDQWWHNMVAHPMEGIKLPEDENEAAKILAPNLLPDPRIDMEAYQKAMDNYRLQAKYEAWYRLVHDGYLLVTPTHAGSLFDGQKDLNPFNNGQVWMFEMEYGMTLDSRSSHANLFGRHADQGVKPAANLRIPIPGRAFSLQPIITLLGWTGRPEDELDGSFPEKIEDLTPEHMRIGAIGIHPEALQLFLSLYPSQLFSKPAVDPLEYLNSDISADKRFRLVANLYLLPFLTNPDIVNSLSPEQQAAVYELEQLIQLTTKLDKETVLKSFSQKMGMEEMDLAFNQGGVLWLDFEFLNFPTNH